MKKRVWAVLLIFIQFVSVIWAQDAYNKWYLVGNPSFEEQVAGVRTTLSEAEQAEKKKWVKDWNAKLQAKAEIFRRETGSECHIVFHRDRASVEKMYVTKMDYPVVIDTTTAKIAAEHIIDSIIELINVPRNQVKITRVVSLERGKRSYYSVGYRQVINNIPVLGTGSSIRFYIDGKIKDIKLSFFPALNASVHSIYTKDGIYKILNKELKISKENIVKLETFYIKGNKNELDLKFLAISSVGRHGHKGDYKIWVNGITGKIDNIQNMTSYDFNYSGNVKGEVYDPTNPGVDGNNRIVGSSIDIGAYEYQGN